MSPVTKIVLVSAASAVGTSIVAGFAYFKGKVDGINATLNGPVTKKLDQALYGDAGKPAIKEDSPIVTAAA